MEALISIEGVGCGPHSVKGCGILLSGFWVVPALHPCPAKSVPHIVTQRLSQLSSKAQGLYVMYHYYFS